MTSTPVFFLIALPGAAHGHCLETAEDSCPVRQLTTHRALDESPRWSPGGGTMAFASTRAGSRDVRVMDVDRDDLRRALGPEDAGKRQTLNITGGSDDDSIL